MTLTEKVAYLKGLVEEGIGVNETTNNGKIMKAVLDVRKDDMAHHPIWRTTPPSCMRK